MILTNWAHKSPQQRKAIIAAYYTYQPTNSQAVAELNIPLRTERKPDKTNIRGSTTTRKSSIKRVHKTTKSRSKK